MKSNSRENTTYEKNGRKVNIYFLLSSTLILLVGNGPLILNEADFSFKLAELAFLLPFLRLPS